MPINTGLGPGSNKILSAAMDRQKMKKHKDRLAKVKPSVDTSAPPIFAHLIHRAKKEQLLEGPLLMAWFLLFFFHGFSVLQRDTQQLKTKIGFCSRSLFVSISVLLPFPLLLS